MSRAPNSPQTSHSQPTTQTPRPGPERMSVPKFRQAKQQGRKLVMLTAYDYSTAKLLDQAGVDGVLVGDSLGMVFQGHPHSLAVTLEEMIYHVRAVARGVDRCLLVADLPFLSYQVSTEQAIANAGRLIKEGNAHAVKMEGGTAMAQRIAAVVAAGIPVMGHVGLTPQSVHQLGGFKVQRDESRLLEDARAVANAGAFAIVVECVPRDTAAKITKAVDVPTIGIGAGSDCDGQILVTHDMLGMFDDVNPRFVKRYAQIGETIRKAVVEYGDDVRAGLFPGPEHEFK